jgi:hypothetical protein
MSHFDEQVNNDQLAGIIAEMKAKQVAVDRQIAILLADLADKDARFDILQNDLSKLKGVTTPATTMMTIVPVSCHVVLVRN